MSEINDLIQTLCPDGVEYKPLGDVLNYEQPTKYIVSSTDYKDEYSTPVLTAGQTFILGYTNEQNGIYKASKENPVIIFDDFTTSFHWVDFDFKVKSSAMKMLRPKDSSCSFKYLNYAIQTIKYAPVDYTRQWIEKYSKFTIPIPPIEVQHKVVNILDRFSAATEELQQHLTAELNARKKQYEYYRDELLNAECRIKNAEFKTLEDLCLKTNNIKWASNNGEFDYIDLTSVNRKNGSIAITKKINKDNAPSRAQQIVKKDDILYATTRPTLNCCCIIKEQYDNQICSTGFAVLRPDKTKIFPLYLYFVISTNKFLDYVTNNQEGTSYPTISDKKLRQFSFMLPPLAEQERIVAILDRYYSFYNDLCISLPAEIEARKKQYEYYRDKLLQFKIKN